MFYAFLGHAGPRRDAWYRWLRFRLLHVVELADDGKIQRENVWVDLAAMILQEQRLLKADAALHELIWGNQRQCRLMLAHLIEQAAKADGDRESLLRQNRRTNLIEAALAPARDQFDDGICRKLCAALALVLGTESMVVFRDVLQMDDPEAGEVEGWAVLVLVRAALKESSMNSRNERDKHSRIATSRQNS